MGNSTFTRPFGGGTLTKAKRPKGPRKAANAPFQEEIIPTPFFTDTGARDPLRGSSTTQQAAQTASALQQLQDAAAARRAFDTWQAAAADRGPASGTNPPAPGGAGGEEWTGFASRYVPGQRDLLFRNPQIITQDWAEQRGKNPHLAGDLARYADIVFGSENAGGLFELLNRGDLSGNFEDDTQINWLVNLLENQSKVGGKSPTVKAMLQALIEGFRDPESTMGSMLRTSSGGDGDDDGAMVGTEQAIGALFQFIPLLGEFTGNQRYSDAIRRQANNLANDYLRRQAKGKTGDDSFLDFFEQTFLR